MEELDTRPVADILARYSTDNQNPVTIDVQVEKCREWCERNGYQVGKIFSDEAVSGMKETRAGYEACMMHLGMGGAQLVVVYDQSRMFREFTEWFQFRKDVDMLGARVASVTQPMVGGDLKDPAVFINEAATAMLNHAQVLITRQKTIDALKHNAREGKSSGGKPPLGYDLDKDKKYVVNEHEAEAVRLVFQLFARGFSYGEIVDELNSRGYLTKRGQSFGKNSIFDLLKNEKYIGRLVYGATKAQADGRWNSHAKSKEDAIVVENGVPAIIEQELWEQVQSRIRTRKGAGGRYSAKREYLLTGRVFCGDCGASMVVMGSKASGYQYYECNNKRRTHTCKMKNVRTEWLEQTVAASIKQMLIEPANIEMLVDVARDQERQITTEYDTRRAELASQYTRVCRQLENGVNALLEGVVSAELKEKVRRLEEEKAEIEAETAELNQYKGYVGLDDATIRRCVENVAKVDIDTPEGLKLILSVVSRVNIHTDTIEIKTLISTDGTDPDPTKSRPQNLELFPSEGLSGEKYHTTPENGSGHQMKTALYSQKRLYSAVFYAFKMLRQRNGNIFYALFVSVPAKQTRMAGRKGMLLFFTSIIFRLDFGIALGMPAYRANFRRACGIRYVSAYHAHPHGGAPLTKNLAVLNVGSQLVVTLFMRFFNVPHAGEQFRQLLKAFTAGGTGKFGIHLGPFIVFPGCRVPQVFQRAGHFAAGKMLKPDLGMFLFIAGCFIKDVPHLLVAVFPRTQRIDLIFCTSVQLARKCGLQIFPRLTVLQFHGQCLPLY